MKTKTSRHSKCFTYLTVFYLVLNSILGLSTTIFAGYLLIFRHEGLPLKYKRIVVCFLIVPALFTLLSTILGWTSIKRRNVNLLKLFAALLAVIDILQIAGCLWCFTSLPQMQEQVLVHTQGKFSSIASDTMSENWWNNIQIKYKCCGLHGPTDYSSVKAVPFSCCGSDPEDTSKGSCSFLWQRGCSFVLSKELSYDLIILGLVGLCVSLLQAPGIFIAWCFAQKLSAQSI